MTDQEIRYHRLHERYQALVKAVEALAEQYDDLASVDFLGMDVARVLRVTLDENRE